MDLAKVLDDIGERLQDARERYPDTPVVTFGHSLGALLTMTYTLQDTPDVVAEIASAPALDSELREQRLKFALANTLAGIVPDVTLPTGLDSKGVSRDPAVVAAYEADPLIHDKGSFGMAKATFNAMDRMMEQTTYPVPLLIIHGTGDRLTVPSASKRFVENVTGDVTLIEYEGLYHELHNEPEQDEVFDDIMEWLEAHLTS
jgi:alpha-beta hydrolase superfamily lysophospholipase